MNSSTEVYSIDYYALLTDSKLNIEINDIRHISYVLDTIDKAYEKHQNELRAGITKEMMLNGLNKETGEEIYNGLLQIMKEKKESLKKEIIVTGHMANISNKTTVRTASVFYQNLQKIIQQQLDIAFSLIIYRLKNFSIIEAPNNGS